MGGWGLWGKGGCVREDFDVGLLVVGEEEGGEKKKICRWVGNFFLFVWTFFQKTNYLAKIFINNSPTIPIR